MINSITLLGSSSGRNAGDAALIAGIMDSVDQHLGREITYEIPTINPSYIRDQYHNQTRPIGMMPWHASVKMLGIPTYRSVMHTDLTLIFDAILFDRSLYNPLFNFMSTLYLMLPLAKKRGKQMAFMNVGAGPVNTRAGKHILKTLSELMDFITVRDKASLDILTGLKVENPRILQTADSAVNVRPTEGEAIDKIYRDLKLDPNDAMLGINVNRYIDTWADKTKASMGTEAFVKTYAAALDKVAETLHVPIVFVCTQHHDIQITNQIMDHMTRRAQTRMIANRNVNHYDIKGAMAKLDLLFGMRLHANILASSALTPIIGLNYQPKVAFYFSDLGLSDFTMSFDDFNTDSLTRHILHGWENRAKIRGILEAKIPVLQARADSAGQLVAALDTGRDLDAEMNGLRAHT